ncbi:MAG: M14 family zinc carboxypeptidase, partial [Thermoanaerobaculia bacterium]|nr:M14 family zinc carboxypeptidase [Thermoanaerobaculia bacterium]
LDYYRRLAESSDRVATWEYGRTYEGRPLQLVAISSPANIARLEELRDEHRRLAEPDRLTPEEVERLVETVPVVVWLGYGVHGNESSSAEAAMAAAYVMAAGLDEWPERLERMVVLIDPLINPDGRERYVHFYETQRGRRPDPALFSAEHWEPWPGGRQNHYVFDLNRDWAWATQRETRARLAAYRQWEPQVFVDFHEMGHESTYFFPPATDPIHPSIAEATVGWLETFGRANAAAFDRQGWLYYVGEDFDLFYPGYGDSYPAFRGAVGMTYEMAGHGRAGQAVERRDGTVLTLADRVARHLTTSLATAATAARHRERLLSDFVATRRAAIERPARHYLWRATDPEGPAAAELLEWHGIRVGRLAAAVEIEAEGTLDDGRRRVELAAGSYVVSTDQPLGALARALLERETRMGEAFLAEQRERVEANRFAEFYDITAFSLPLAYNLEVWHTDGHRPATGAAPAGVGVSGEGDLGHLARPGGLAGYRFAAELLERGVRFRLLLAETGFGERRFPAGTVWIPARGRGGSSAADVEELAAGHGVELLRVATGLADHGISLGSNAALPVRPPRVGLVSGRGVGTTSFGHLWHLLDQTVTLPVHRIESTLLSRVDLSELDVLVLPDGSYSTLDEEVAGELGGWVAAGGLLVAIEDAVGWLRRHELVDVASWQPPEAEEVREARDVARLEPGRRRLYTPGAALASELGGPHPLLAGLPHPPPVLYRSATVLLPSGDPQRDLLLADREDPVLAGFAWPEAAARLRGALLAGVETRGRGAVVLLAQDPVFRGFWRGTAPIFLNAVLYGASLAEQGELAGAAAAGEKRRAAPAGGSARLADVDLAAPGLEVHLRPAAVDGAAGPALDGDPHPAAVALSAHRGGLRDAPDVESGVDLAAVAGVDPNLGAQVRREGHVHVAVEGAEGHRAAGGDLAEARADVAVGGLRDQRATDLHRLDGAVGVHHLVLALDAAHDDVAAVDALELQIGLAGHPDLQIDGLGPGAPRLHAHPVVLLGELELHRLGAPALEAVRLAPVVVVVGPDDRLDDHLGAVVALDRDAAVGLLHLQGAGPGRVAEGQGEALGLLAPGRRHDQEGRQGGGRENSRLRHLKTSFEPGLVGGLLVQRRQVLPDRLVQSRPAHQLAELLARGGALGHQQVDHRHLDQRRRRLVQAAGQPAPHGGWRAEVAQGLDGRETHVGARVPGGRLHQRLEHPLVDGRELAAVAHPLQAGAGGVGAQQGDGDQLAQRLHLAAQRLALDPLRPSAGEEAHDQPEDQRGGRRREPSRAGPLPPLRDGLPPPGPEAPPGPRRLPARELVQGGVEAAAQPRARLFVRHQAEPLPDLAEALHLGTAVAAGGQVVARLPRGLPVHVAGQQVRGQLSDLFAVHHGASLCSSR